MNPADYEACGECGYDHQYEPQEAHRGHMDKPIIIRARLDADRTAKPLSAMVQHVRTALHPDALCQGPGINIPDSYVTAGILIPLKDEG